MNELIAAVQREVDAILPEMVALRHALHREPEIALHEEKTREKILAALTGTSVSMWKPLVGTDVIAELPGHSTRTICLRADIDALPVEEANDLPYRSIVPGMMHACGHDGHTAMLVGAARVLDRLRDRLPLGVRFIFQPGEEVEAAGRLLVEQGACDGCEAAYALHGWPGLPAGAISTNPGVIFAAGSFFTATITGKGCHGAQPDKGNNPIPIAARIASALHAHHQAMHAEAGTVISVCAFQAGMNGNIIPDTAVLKGTARYLTTDIGDEVDRRIRETILAEVSASGAVAEIELTRNYGLPVDNTRSGYEVVKSVARAALAPGQWIENTVPTMGNEDFAYYLPGREGAMFFLGNGVDSAPLHTASYDFNDHSLAAGILVYCLVALTDLTRQQYS